MPASWELPRYGPVLVGVLHVDVVTTAWAMGLRKLELPGGGAVVPVAGMPFDMARNVLAMQALDAGAEWLFFLDSDVIPPPDAVRRLIDRDLPIVSGLYARRSPPHAVPVAIKNGAWLTQYKPGELVDVDLVGAGCLLIHHSVLRNLPPVKPGRHWFSWQVDLKGVEPQEWCLSEDFVWCRWAQKHGYRIILDTSVVCRHVGSAQSTPGQFVPLETGAA